MSKATNMPSSKPKVVAENARSEKPLSISSMAIISPPKPKPIIMPNTSLWLTPRNSVRTWLMAKPAAMHRLKNKRRMVQSEVMVVGPLLVGGVLVGGSSWCQRKCHKPSRFRLLVVMARLSAIICTLVESCSFCNTVPARPFPDCKSCITFVKTSVEVSTFLIAAEISVPLDEMIPWASSDRWMRSCEK